MPRFMISFGIGAVTMRKAACFVAAAVPPLCVGRLVRLALLVHDAGDDQTPVPAALVGDA